MIISSVIIPAGYDDNIHILTLNNIVSLKLFCLLDFKFSLLIMEACLSELPCFLLEREILCTIVCDFRKYAEFGLQAKVAPSDVYICLGRKFSTMSQFGPLL